MTCLWLLATFTTLAQGQSMDSASIAAKSVSEKTISRLSGKYGSLETTIDRRSIDVLDQMEKQETALQRKLPANDSAAGRQMLSTALTRYEALKTALQSPVDNVTPARLREYIPGLDSLQSAVRFLSTGNLPSGKLQQLTALTQQLQQLQGRLQQANEVQSFISQREQQLQSQFTGPGVGGRLLSMNKQAYYYQQQLTQYKSIINDKQRLEQTVLATVSQLPAFKSFIQKNGMMAQLFPAPANFGSATSIAGLQTAAQVQNMITQQVGKGSSQSPGAEGGPGTNNMDPRQFIAQQTQAAQTDLDKLKNRMKQLGNGSIGSTSMTMPDFTPNTQKTKSFLKRLEYGLSIQNTPSTYVLPVTSAVAGTIGYRISDKATAGVGVSYNLGWGTDIDHIHFTSQGIGLRSYADIKAKGSIWITGGYEYNYMQQFSSLADIQHFDLWQKSALLGLTKKFSLNKKMGGNLQLLYDFLASSQVPQAAPFKFRIGYSFN